MGKSNISYLDHVFSPITGCSGKDCQAHCYAREIVRRFPAIHNADLTVPTDFSQVVFHPYRLSEPLKRKKPTVYGVGFFGDMFDEQVKIEWLRDLHKTMWAADRHQYVLLTKQPQRMASVLSDPWFWPSYYRTDHIWHGTTVCTQEEADTRIPEILKVPGRKWLSIEPMLGPIDLRPTATNAYKYLSRYYGPNGFDESGSLPERDRMHGFPMVDLVVVGGESGPKARPMHPDWVRSIRDQCAAAGVSFYMKQWGEWSTMIPTDGELRANVKRDWAHFEDGSFMKRVGTKSAGRLLDGKLHDELPWRKA